MSDFAKDLLSSVLAARQNIPRLGGSAPAAYAPTMPVANVSMDRSIKTEIDLGGWVAALERFGIIPKDPDTIRELGLKFIASLHQYPPDQIAQTIKQAPSQALLKQFHKNAVPGVIQLSDGTFDIAPTYAMKHMDPGLIGWRQLFGQQPERQAYGSGALGQQAMERYRETARSAERAPTQQELLQQQNLFVPSVQAQIQHQQAEAKKANAEAQSTEQLIVPRARAYEAGAAKDQAYAEYLKGNKGEEAKELQKARLISIKDLFDTHRKNREIFIKHVTDPMTIPVDRAASTVQFASNALSTIEGMLTNGAEVLHPNVTVAARDFLQAGRDLAQVPLSTMNASNWVSTKPTETWNNLLIRSYDDHTQFLRTMKGHNPHMAVQAMMNQLNMMEKMDLSNPELRERMIRDWKKMRMAAEAAGMRLNMFDQVKAKQGWTDAMIKQVR